MSSKVKKSPRSISDSRKSHKPIHIRCCSRTLQMRNRCDAARQASSFSPTVNIGLPQKRESRTLCQTLNPMQTWTIPQGHLKGSESKTKTQRRCGTQSIAKVRRSLARPDTQSRSPLALKSNIKTTFVTNFQRSLETKPPRRALRIRSGGPLA